MKKYFFKIFIVTFTCIVFTACSSNNIKNLYEHNKFGDSLILDAKTKYYENLEDLEKDAEVIVIARKISQDKPTIIKADGSSISHAHTKSTLKVIKSFKGTLSVDDEFSVLESEAYDENSKLTIHIGKYEMMRLNSDYVLFLRKSQSIDSYLILAINFGKTPIEYEEGKLIKNLRSINTDRAKDELESFNVFEKIRKDIKNKYLNN